MAYHRGQNSTFEFDVLVCSFCLDLQLNIQVSCFSALLVDLTLFVSPLGFVVGGVRHSGLRSSAFGFRGCPAAGRSMAVGVGSANCQIAPLVGAGKGSSLHHNIYMNVVVWDLSE